MSTIWQCSFVARARFRTKVGPERLARIVDQAVEVLVAKGRIKGEALALDSTFIKASVEETLTTARATAIPNQELARALNRIATHWRLFWRLHLKFFLCQDKFGVYVSLVV